MAAKFHLKKAKDGQFHFNLHAANGEIILTSELYKAKDSALGGIESVRKNSQRDGAFEVKRPATASSTSYSRPPMARSLARASSMPARPMPKPACSR